MSPNRLLVLGTDAAYFEYTVIALRSFQRHNPNWPALVMDVGMTPEQVRSLQPWAQVLPYPREEFRGGGMYIPSAKARCLALAQFPADDTLMLYLDGDTVTLGSVEPLFKQFLASGKPIGIAREGDPRFWTYTAGQAWEDLTIPPDFPEGGRWSSQPMLNTGVLLAVGPTAAAVGRKCAALYDQLKTRFRFGEQTIINAVLYEDRIPLFDLPIRYHCFLFEPYLQKTGRPYIDPVYLDGQEVVIRHFCSKNKGVLDSLQPALWEHYAAGLELPTPARQPVSQAPDPALQPSPGAQRMEPFSSRPSPTATARQFLLEEAVRLLNRKEIPAPRVLEIGCSSREAGHRLRQTLAAEAYVVFTASLERAQAAPAHLEEVQVASLEATAPEDLGLPEGSFDLLVALDVLGHVRDPRSRLAGWVRFLRPGGHVLASVPNLQNVHVLLKLAQGRWLPPGGGTSGDVPLRFFTWDSWKELLTGAGLRIRCAQALLDPPLDPSQLPELGNLWQQGPLTLTNLTREEMTRLCTQQFLVLARKETPRAG